MLSNRVLAYDQEKLQFIADFKTTDKEPGSLFAISSRFHRYFLKNIDPKDINIRLLRIPNVVPNSPKFFGFGNVPQVHQVHNNNLGAYSTPNVYPILGPQSARPGYSYFNLNTNHPGPNHYAVNLRPNNYHQYQAFPTPFPSHYMAPPPPQAPYKTPGFTSHPYAFEHFGIPNRNLNNPFYQLNAGEVPHQYQPQNIGQYYRPFNGNSNLIKRSLATNSTDF